MGASHSEALAALGSDSDEEDENARRMPTISDALGRGLAVKVNGNNWKRAHVHVDEDEEEAVVIVYGLVPRKKYEISLGIAASDEPIRETITTQSGQDEQTAVEMPAAPTNEHVTDSAASPSTLTPPTTPIRSSPPRTITQEERAAQLRKQLAHLHTERDDLASQLKAARRESQRTETALKGEIETLKRASEKHASGEHRSRQKELALKEAVKQTHAATEEVEQMVREIEHAIPALNARAMEAEAEHNAVKQEAERSNAQTEDALRADKKMVADLQGELTGMCARLEKVTGKKERLEKEVVPQLEERLQELRREIAEMERVTPGDEDLQHGTDELHGQLVSRRVPPIQRPQQRPGFTPTTSFGGTTPPFSPPRQPASRSARPAHTKQGNTTLAPLLPSYDPNFSLRGLVASEDMQDTNGPLPRVTYGNTSPFDFVVRRPSPNPTTESREPPSRQSSLPTPENYLDGGTRPYGGAAAG